MGFKNIFLHKNCPKLYSQHVSSVYNSDLHEPSDTLSDLPFYITTTPTEEAVFEQFVGWFVGLFVIESVQRLVQIQGG